MKVINILRLFNGSVISFLYLLGMKVLLLMIGVLASLSVWGQGVLASGLEPAWILDWDGQDRYTLFVGEEQFEYELLHNTEPEGSSTEIAQTWVFRSEKGATATLVIEFFDPESAESCPCFHDFGEGYNAGKAYFISENHVFYIGCADYVEQPMSQK